MDMQVVANMEVFYRRIVMEHLLLFIDRCIFQDSDAVPDLKVTPGMAIQLFMVPGARCHVRQFETAL